MPVDGKWLEEILKANGWKTGAIAIACGVLLLMDKWLSLGLYPWVAQALIIGGVICGFLCLGSIAAAIWSWTEPRLSDNLAQARETANVTAVLPHLSPKEKEIIGTLLAAQRRFFEGDDDAGHANTLVAKGVVMRSRTTGSYLPWNVSFEVPPHVWKVLLENQDLFPKCDPDGQPWRIHWQAR